jgi:YqaJ-like viral recombinase domain
MRTQIKPHQEFNPAAHLFDGLQGLQNRQVAKIDIAADTRETKEFEEWKKQRLGKITGSRFGEVNKLKVARGGKKKGEWSGTTENYLYEILAEYITGVPTKDFTAKATEWGIKHEKEAIELYEKIRNVKVEPLGFKQLTKYVGCTVDGQVIGENGVIEVKCPWNAGNHAKNIDTNEIPSEYFEQVLGHLLITGSDWCDFISYDPRSKLEQNKIHIIRLNRSDVIFELQELEETLREFEVLLIEKLKKMKLKSKI